MTIKIQWETEWDARTFLALEFYAAEKVFEQSRSAKAQFRDELTALVES